MGLERRIYFPEEMSEKEEKERGFTTIDWFTNTYQPGLRMEVDLRHLGKISEYHKEAFGYRRTFFPLGPDKLFPIEALIFEHSLIERLLRNERYQTGRSLRIDFSPQDSLSFTKSIVRLKKPEDVYQRRSEIKKTMKIIDKSFQALLDKYASEIGVDKESREFKAWVGSLEGLANNFSAAIFEEARNDVLYTIVDKRKRGIIQKRKAMLELVES